MKLINKFPLSQSRTSESFGFHKKVEEKTPLLTSESDKIIVAQYIAAIAVFDQAEQQNERNSHTEEVEQADRMADAAFRGLKAQAKAMLNFPMEAQRTAAKTMYDRIDKYGDISRMTYSEEYGRM